MKKKYLNIIATAIFILLSFSCNKDNGSSSGNNTNPTTKNYLWTNFSMGADLSYNDQMVDSGVIYRDSSIQRDIFTIFKNHGCNTVRIRLWHAPNQYAGGIDQQYNDLAHVEIMLQKAKNLGMAVNLDLHFSDTWADPGHQYTPAAWTNLNFTTLTDTVYNYTYNVLTELQSKNLVPEMIQLGNEINNGFLWPSGEINNNNFDSCAILLSSAIKAVRDFSATSTIKPKIILHVAQLENAQWWFSGITNAGVTDFDIIGMSHYANYSTVNTMSDITSTFIQLKNNFNKEVMIVETAYWWNTKDCLGNSTDITPLSGYPFDTASQAQYLRDLTQAVMAGGGNGVQYWAPDYISNTYGGEMTARTLVDFNGNVLPGINFMNYIYTQ